MIEQWRKNNWSQGGKKPMQHFFETNHAGELPIILKRRNNTQTAQNNDDKETDRLNLDTATPTPLKCGIVDKLNR